MNTSVTTIERFIMDQEDRYPDATGELSNLLYDLALGSNARTKQVGEWNSGRILVKGWHVQHWLNGEKVVDVDLASAEGKALIAASKFKDWAKFASLSRGHIALQEHGHAVSFRAIKIRELK